MMGDEWGWALSEIHNQLNCLKSVELQVVLATPGHQMVTKARKP